MVKSWCIIVSAVCIDYLLFDTYRPVHDTYTSGVNLLIQHAVFLFY